MSFSHILRQELAELEQDITLQDEIYKELLEDFNEWVTEQLEEEENYLLQVAESQELVCPICQISNLVVYQSREDYFNYRCKCNAK